MLFPATSAQYQHLFVVYFADGLVVARQGHFLDQQQPYMEEVALLLIQQRAVEELILLELVEQAQAQAVREGRKLVQPHAKLTTVPARFDDAGLLLMQTQQQEHDFGVDVVAESSPSIWNQFFLS